VQFKLNKLRTAYVKQAYIALNFTIIRRESNEYRRIASTGAKKFRLFSIQNSLVFFLLQQSQWLLILTPRRIDFRTVKAKHKQLRVP
jgi:hypothetical protein